MLAKNLKSEKNTIWLRQHGAEGEPSQTTTASHCKNKSSKCIFYSDRDCIVLPHSSASIFQECVSCSHIDDLDHALINFEYHKSNEKATVMGVSQ